jgi:hypothetical protein
LLPLFFIKMLEKRHQGNAVAAAVINLRENLANN